LAVGGGATVVGSEPAGAGAGAAAGCCGVVAKASVAVLAATSTAARSARTPRPTSTPHRKITTETTVAAMNRKTNCFPFSWISWKPSSCTCDATDARDCTTLSVAVPVLTCVQARDQRGCFSQRRVELERAVGLGARRGHVLRLPVRLAEDGVGFGGLRAP